MTNSAINLTKPTNEIIQKLFKLPFSTNNVRVFGGAANKSSEDLNRIFSAIPQGVNIRIDSSVLSLGTELYEAIANLKNKKIKRLSLNDLNSMSEERLGRFFQALPSDIHELKLSNHHRSRVFFNTTNSFLLFPNHISKLELDYELSEDSNEIIQMFSILPRNLEAMVFNLRNKTAVEVVQILRALPRLQCLQISISDFKNYTPEEQGFILSEFPPSLKKVRFNGMLISEMDFYSTLASHLCQLPEGITSLAFSGHRIGSSLHLDQFLSAVPGRFTSLSLEGRSAWLTSPNKSTIGFFCKRHEPLLPSVTSRLESIELAPKTKSEIYALEALPKNLHHLLVDLRFVKFYSGQENEKGWFEALFNILRSRSGKTTFICSDDARMLKVMKNIPSNIKHVIFSNQNIDETSDHNHFEGKPIWEIRREFESLTSMCSQVLYYLDGVDTIALNYPAIRRLKPETRERLRVLLKCKFKEVIIDGNEAVRVIPAVQEYLNLPFQQGQEQNRLNADLLGLSLSYLGNVENFAEMIRNDTENATSLSLLQDWLKKQKETVKESNAALFKKVEEFCIESEDLLKQGKDKAPIYIAAFLTLELLEGNIPQEEYKKLLTSHNSYKFHKKLCGIIFAIAVLSILLLLAVDPLLLYLEAGHLTGFMLSLVAFFSSVAGLNLIFRKSTEVIDYRLGGISDENEAHPFSMTMSSSA